MFAECKLTASIRYAREKHGEQERVHSDLNMAGVSPSIVSLRYEGAVVLPMLRWR